MRVSGKSAGMTRFRQPKSVMPWKIDAEPPPAHEHAVEDDVERREDRARRRGAPTNQTFGGVERRRLPVEGQQEEEHPLVEVLQRVRHHVEAHARLRVGRLERAHAARPRRRRAGRRARRAATPGRATPRASARARSPCARRRRRPRRARARRPSAATRACGRARAGSGATRVVSRIGGRGAQVQAGRPLAAELHVRRALHAGLEVHGALRSRLWSRLVKRTLAPRSHSSARRLSLRRRDPRRRSLLRPPASRRRPSRRRAGARPRPPSRPPCRIPRPRRVDQVDDAPRRRRCADPYRWLEDGKSDEVKKWVDRRGRARARVPREAARRATRWPRASRSSSTSRARARRATSATACFYRAARRRQGEVRSSTGARAGTAPEKVLLDPNHVVDRREQSRSACGACRGTARRSPTP